MRYFGKGMNLRGRGCNSVVTKLSTMHEPQGSTLALKKKKEEKKERGRD
jgi:hypothetical protein